MTADLSLNSNFASQLEEQLQHKPSFNGAMSTSAGSLSSISTNAEASTSYASLRRESTELLLQSTSQHVASQSPPLTLAQYGIKIRDFAYESTLPPIAPVLRLPRQVQPGPRSLKRARKSCDNDTSLLTINTGSSQVGDGEGNTSVKRSKPLERQMTEPVDESSQGHTNRYRAIENLGQRQYSIVLPSNPESSIAPGNSLHFLSSQSPPPLGSQDTEPYVNTPLVTPNGSLHWPNSDDAPASQLDAHSQLSRIEAASFLQREATLQISGEDPPLRATSPMSPLSEAPVSPLTPITPLEDLPEEAALPSTPSPQRSRSVSPVQAKSIASAPPELSRYHFRQRPAITPKSPPVGSRRRERSARPPTSVSMQSSHAKKGPSRGRVLKKGTANGQEAST